MPGRRFSALETQLKSQSFSEISAAYTAAPFLPRPLNSLFIPNQFGFFPPWPCFVLAIHYCAASSDSLPQRVLFTLLCCCLIRSHLVVTLLHQRWPSGLHWHPTARRSRVQFPPGDFLSGVCMFILCPNPKDVHVEATGPWCHPAFDPRQLGYDPECRVSRD